MSSEYVPEKTCVYKSIYKYTVKPVTDIYSFLDSWFFDKFASFLNDQEKTKTTKSMFQLLKAALVLCIVLFIINLEHFHGLKEGDETNIGQFGDFFGGVLNPLLTFITFMALLLTIVLQQKELAETRKEISASTAALEQQSETQKKQRFENTFFELLNQHNSILKALSENENFPMEMIDPESEAIEWGHVTVIRGIHTNSIHYKATLEASNAEMHKHNDRIGHYFRLLYQILKFIAISYQDQKIDFSDPKTLLSTPVSDEERFYSNLLRATLDYRTNQILAVNCYCKDASDPFYRFKCLIVRYRFLEHMPFKIAEGDLKLKTILETYNHYSENDHMAFGNSQFVKEMLLEIAQEKEWDF